MEDNREGASRRTVLKGMAAGATALGLPAAASAAPDSNPVRALAGKSIFVESDVKLGRTASAETTGRIDEADVAVLDARTGVHRGRIVRALKRDVPVAFVGAGADDALVSLLYGTPPADAADAMAGGAPAKLADVPMSFGLEYEPDDDAFVAALSPRGTVLDTHVYRTDRPTPEFALSRVGRTLQLRPGLGTRATTDDATNDAGTAAYACPDAENGWSCLGRSHTEKDLNEHGQIEKFVWGAKAADETDPYRDYFSWKTKMSMTPGTALGRSDWQNDYAERTVDFGDELAKHGPPSTSGSSSSSFSVGVDVGVSATGPNVGGSLGWGWSTTHSHTNIEEVVDLTGEKVTHTFSLKKGENVAQSTFNGHPGYRIEPVDGTTTVNYSYDTYWQFVDDGTFGDDTWTYHLYGDGNWSV